MTTTTNRQGRIAGFLKQEGSSLIKLAKHCGLSKGVMSRHCNAEEVPTKVLARMKSFRTATEKHIPHDYLPEGRDKKPGPAKGWLERKLAEVGGSVASDAA